MNREVGFPFFSFRARVVLLMTLVMLVTTAATYYINKHMERRVTSLVAEHIKAMSLSVDLMQSSLVAGEYLYNLVPKDGRLAVGLDESHIIHRIIFTDNDWQIIDSTERGDIGRRIQPVTGSQAPLTFLDARPDAANQESEQLLTYPMVTDKGERHVVIVVSPHKLADIVREESRERLAAIAALSFLLIVLIAVVSWRFTRPVRELANAAHRVSAGDIDFTVSVAQKNEMGTLARAFNEMLKSLRDKRELEERLQRAERSALAGRFAAGIAHEIRNPLSFINLTIDFLRHKFPPAAEAMRAEYEKLCDSMKEEIERLNRLVSDFLSYGRPARLKLRELDARQLADEVIGLVRAKAEQQSVQLAVREESNDGQTHDTRFQGDAEQLKTCFSNLAINAVQAMPKGGSLTITIHPHEANIRVEFADTGTGIAPESLEHIFEPYFSTKDTGTGLGLALTKKLIEDHGGQIMVNSEVGVGTIFTVILPREPATAAQQPALLSQTAQNPVGI
jgi:signal transduction histidine kinase